ncbi:MULTISPECIES: phosphate ABC transporter substrate-binding protein [unclassified Fusibacter]|uniref:phosphate ABC transporter substrate-binding protein n=1 Tax=unclassified Fusibacter TaxID=2624464 RepID=UPI0010119FDA|nr:MULTISPECIES: phosphate ABC transporter substrate-binding protein [unclassified Fusibacter]MCK8061302.1 phosphate ABC transporter substrate-binding protein [Fusibacter sp. A2]NPE23501.1 phosphate ABC transporter substrate-binding protein [Fusibacter sp. A1]RXV59107.1 phosphate ABC transporter substrate-binding protein [Fusibacter sp. A1]
MKLGLNKLVILVVALVMVVGIFAGCSSNASDNGGQPAPEQKETVNASDDAGQPATELKGSINVVGSTSVTPVAQQLAEKFMEINSGVKVNVQGVGSSAGVKATDDGSAAIGMASRNLKEAEKAWGIDEYVIAFDGIAVVVHPSNGVKELTTDQVTAIFNGSIKNWNELGGSDHEILVVSREEGSGTRGAFEELMNLESDNGSTVREDALFAEGNGAVKANIASKDYAIGYVSLSYLDESVQTVKIDGVEATVENIVAGSYSVSRPFLMLTKGQVDPLAQAYLDFVFSAEGQAIVAENLIPVK